MRNQIERIIKEQKIERKNFHEVSKLQYNAVLKKIQATFVSEGKKIHWGNMGKYNSKICCKFYDVREDNCWFEKLNEIIPVECLFVYALFEDKCRKYWVYETKIPELIQILSEAEGLPDYYIVSKKFNWLISENHESIVSLVGTGFHTQIFETER